MAGARHVLTKPSHSEGATSSALCLLSSLDKALDKSYFKQQTSLASLIDDEANKSSVLEELSNAEKLIDKLKTLLIIKVDTLEAPISEALEGSIREVLLSIKGRCVNKIAEINSKIHNILHKSLVIEVLESLSAEAEECANQFYLACHPEEMALKLYREKKHQININKLLSKQALLSSDLNIPFTSLLEKVKQLGKEFPPAGCFISYAWPQPDSDEEKWLQPFLRTFHGHLITAGIASAKLDIVNSHAGGNIHRFMEAAEASDFVMLIGTDNLLKKHKEGVSAVCTELAYIASKREKDAKKGMCRVLPINLGSDYSDTLPAGFRMYTNILDWPKKDYLMGLKELLRNLYQFDEKYANYNQLWLDFIEKNSYPLEFNPLDSSSPALLAHIITPDVLLPGKKAPVPTISNSFGIPFENRHYVARAQCTDAIIAKLKSQLGRPIVLSTLKGLGGVGKTQLALDYIRHPPLQYSYRIWFDAESLENLSIQFLEFGEKLGLLTKSINISTGVERVKLWLEENPGWIIVFDNAFSQEQLQPYLPSGGGHILVTSRTQFWETDDIIPIDVMEKLEAYSLIQKITGIHDKSITPTIQSLAEKLDYLPLAISQASAFIKNKKLSPAEYLTLYETLAEKLLSEPVMLPGDKHNPVSVTWLLNFEAAEKECHEAQDILHACAYLNANNLSEEVLIAYLPSHATPHENTYTLRNAIGALSNYSLIKVNEDGSEMSIHRLVQSVIRSRLNHEQAALTMNKLIEIIGNKLDKDHYKVITEQRNLFAHFDSVLSHFLTSSELKPSMSSFHAFGKCAQIHTRFIEAPAQRKAIAYCEYALSKLDTPDSLAAAELYNTLGNAYRETKEHNQAALNYNKAIAIAKHVEGDNSFSVAKYYNNLGVLNEDIGTEISLQTSIRYHIEALKIKRILFKDTLHASTAISLNSLANAYITSAKPENIAEAEKLHVEALKMRQTLFGDTHPETATSYNNLGNAFFAQGKLKEAYANYQRSFEIRKEKLPSGHPYTLLSHYNLVKTCHAMEDLKAKTKFLHDALANFRQFCPLNHIYISTTQALIDEMIKKDTDSSTYEFAS